MSLHARLDRLESENRLLRQVVLDLQWLSIAQVSRAAGCSERTVHRLIKSGDLPYRYEGRRPMCSLDGVRLYLTGKKIDALEIEYRLINAHLLANETNGRNSNKMSSAN